MIRPSGCPFPRHFGHLRLVQRHAARSKLSERSGKKLMKPQVLRPTAAFIGASWGALFVGAIAYLVGLWNAQMPLYEKGYYFTILMFGLFAAVSLQKSVRDQLQ